MLQRDQNSGVTGRQAAILQHLQYIGGQRQQPCLVGDVAAAFAQRLRELLLSVTEPLHQLPKGLRFVDRVQIGALYILDNGDFQALRCRQSRGFTAGT